MKHPGWARDPICRPGSRAVGDLHAIDCGLLRSQRRWMIGGTPTGALIKASVVVPCIIAGSDENTLVNMSGYGECVGLAFQVQDDILDVTASTEQLGKQAGADSALNKPTYPALLGLSGARQRARELHEAALQRLSVFDSQADPLRWLSEYIVGRTN